MSLYLLPARNVHARTWLKFSPLSRSPSIFASQYLYICVALHYLLLFFIHSLDSPHPVICFFCLLLSFLLLWSFFSNFWRPIPGSKRIFSWLFSTSPHTLSGTRLSVFPQLKIVIYNERTESALSFSCCINIKIQISSLNSTGITLAFLIWMPFCVQTFSFLFPFFNSIPGGLAQFFNPFNSGRTVLLLYCAYLSIYRNSFFFLPSLHTNSILFMQKHFFRIEEYRRIIYKSNFFSFSAVISPSCSEWWEK